jgi:phosphatidylserine decarboxylase
MFHKEGGKIILISTFLSVVGVFLADYFLSEKYPLLFKIIGVLILAFLVLILQFFRNPTRIADNSDNHILAPVDGKVVVIEEVYEPEYFKDKRLMVSIFMSPINVHVTRYCVNGIVKYSKYHPGKYLVAWHPKASEENERTTVVIDNRIFGDILYGHTGINAVFGRTQCVKGDIRGKYFQVPETAVKAEIIVHTHGKIIWLVAE